MTPGLLAAAALAGLLVGASLGMLGGGGSILAVPVLLALGQTAGQATTGSLAVVAATSLVGAVAAQRAGSTVLVGRGLAFGGLAVGGAALGASAAGAVPDELLLLAFAALLLLVAGLMVRRLLRARGDAGAMGEHRRTVRIDDPIITFSPQFACACPRAVKVLVTATVVGLLTGFLGVGGGFLVVPALVLALGLPMTAAVGTSLVAITVTSLAALLVRLGSTTQPDWSLVGLLTGLAVVGALLGAWAARRVDAARLQAAFTAVLVVVAVWTAARGLPAVA
jgi:uncharacterized membrane protein YfcA